jgi:hypothetical protein
MANECETWIRINSNIISFDTLRKTIIEGFEHNGRNWECPFTYGDQTDDIDGANPDPMYLNQVYGISRWELDAEYGFALHSHLRSMDKNVILFVIEEDEMCQWMRLRIHHGDSEVEWHSYEDGNEEEGFNRFDIAEDAFLKQAA